MPQAESDHCVRATGHQRPFSSYGLKFQGLPESLLDLALNTEAGLADLQPADKIPRAEFHRRTANEAQTFDHLSALVGAKYPLIATGCGPVQARRDVRRPSRSTKFIRPMADRSSASSWAWRHRS